VRLSVVICTKDEQERLGRCLDSVAWADEVLVLDSGSTDRTRELAAERGAVVHRQGWLGFSRQKNRAAALASHDWILSLDADEVVTPALAASIRGALEARPDPHDGFALDRRADFLGRWLPNQARRSKRHELVRLYNRRFSGWDEAMPVHEIVRCPGRTHLLPGWLLHWNDFDLDALITLFNRYATVEAHDLHDRGVRVRASSVVIRPVARFLWLYLARGEVRLGAHGVVHSGLKAASEFMRYAKLWELQQPRAPRAAAPQDGAGDTVDGQVAPRRQA